MDFLLSAFFNSKTKDPKVKTPPAPPGRFQKLGDDLYFRPWKWDWRQTRGQGWFEVGDRVFPLQTDEAALGKLTVRVWNRNERTNEMVAAEVQVRVKDSAGKQYDINTVFSAYKYRDKHGKISLVAFQDGDKGNPIDLMHVPGGHEANAEYGDQRMRMWDVLELYFVQSPQNYIVNIAFWVRFGISGLAEHEVFFLDPETDPAIETSGQGVTIVLE